MIYDEKKFIGNVIRNARKRAKLSQAQLAERVEMSDKNLGNIENGKQFPQVNNFLRIMEILSWSLEDFGINIEKNIDDQKKNYLIKKMIEAKPSKINGYFEAIEFIDKILKWFMTFCKKVGRSVLPNRR